MVLLALAGTISGAGSLRDSSGRGAVFPPEDTAGPVTGDNSCTACLDQCNTRYPAFGYPVTNWFCRFGCLDGLLPATPGV